MKNWTASFNSLRYFITENFTLSQLIRVMKRLMSKIVMYLSPILKFVLIHRTKYEFLISKISFAKYHLNIIFAKYLKIDKVNRSPVRANMPKLSSSHFSIILSIHIQIIHDSTCVLEYVFHGPIVVQKLNLFNSYFILLGYM